jgi:hypothetical protein
VERRLRRCGVKNAFGMLVYSGRSPLQYCIFDVTDISLIGLVAKETGIYSRLKRITVKSLIGLYLTGKT